MNLYQLVYTSKLTRPIAPRALKYLLEKSKLKNIESDITGVLIKDGLFMLQVLEGDRHILQSLYDQIESDDRHINVKQCYFEPSEFRIFGKWAMTFLNLEIDNNPALTHIKQKQIVKQHLDTLNTATQSTLSTQSSELLFSLDEIIKN